MKEEELYALIDEIICFLQVFFPGFCNYLLQQLTQGILRVVFH